MTPAFLDITILGSGTSTGIPVIGCDCQVCRSDDQRDQRTRCSALLSFSGHNVLIDTSTDLRTQALREGIRTIDAVLYTHSHADHVHGIDDLRSFNLRSRKAIPIYAAEATLERLRQMFNYIFDDGMPYGFVPLLEPCRVDGPFELFGLRFEPIPLLHGELEVLGYRCGSFAYLTDCSAVPETSLPLLQDLALLVIDGLRFKSHPTHFNISQATELAIKVGAERTLLTHLSHDVDHRKDGQNLPAGIEFAYDGQQVKLPIEATQAARMKSAQWSGQS